jgi:hypothetical protein
MKQKQKTKQEGKKDVVGDYSCLLLFSHSG